MKKKLGKLIEAQQKLGDDPKAEDLEKLQKGYMELEQSCDEYLRVKKDKLATKEKNKEYDERGALRYNIVSSLKNMLSDGKSLEMIRRYPQGSKVAAPEAEAEPSKQKEQANLKI